MKTLVLLTALLVSGGAALGIHSPGSEALPSDPPCCPPCCVGACDPGEECCGDPGCTDPECCTGGEEGEAPAADEPCCGDDGTGTK